MDPLHPFKTLFGIFGWPTRHSLSPAMHNAVFRALDLPCRYEVFEVAPDHLPDAVRAIRALGWEGSTSRFLTATVRWKFMQVAGRIVRHAGPTILKLAVDAKRFLEFEQIRRHCFERFDGDAMRSGNDPMPC